MASTRGVRRDAMLREVTRWTPDGATRDGLLRARSSAWRSTWVCWRGARNRRKRHFTRYGSVLGPGGVQHLDSYEEALWTATAHPGLDLASNAFVNFAVDRDTVGAIVGGIVACATGVDGILILWREATGKLPL